MTRFFFYLLVALFFLSIPYTVDKKNKDSQEPADRNQPVQTQDAKLPPPSELPPDGLWFTFKKPGNFGVKSLKYSGFFYLNFFIFCLYLLQV